MKSNTRRSKYDRLGDVVAQNREHMTESVRALSDENEHDYEEDKVLFGTAEFYHEIDDRAVYSWQNDIDRNLY